MVALPAGSFLMGSPAGVGSREEHPQHSVTVAAFQMDANLVTVADYTKCVHTGACTPAPTTVDWSGISDDDVKTWSPFCNGARVDRSTHPINCVDWDQATAYCKWAGKRLPTEEEWEYAARGIDDRTYPWGEAPPDETRVNACGSECADMAKRSGHKWSALFGASDGWEGTSPVGNYPAGRTPEGLFDMAGNVWEWTASTYVRYDGTGGTSRLVCRGGSWDSYMSTSLRGANRITSAKSEHRNTIGFRCAQ
jgi:formylglycine-generating enzyme required for sulfatase activity